MKSLYHTFFLLAGLTATLRCQNVDPVFGTEQRYKHDLFSSEAECLQRLGFPRLEFNCSETVTFGTDGRVYLLLGGGDIGVSSHYKRKGNMITIDFAPGLPNKIEFKVVSDAVLIRVGSGTQWHLY